MKEISIEEQENGEAVVYISDPDQGLSVKYKFGSFEEAVDETSNLAAIEGV